jgi:Ni,Fe-hydrogenase I cytochrome b subunit
LKFPESWWAHPVLLWEGHFALRGTIHRVAAVVLLLSIGYHVVHLIVDRRAALILRHMAPHLKDFRDLQDMLTYNLGISSKRPAFGEFGYVEKLEYLAFMWGTIVMAVTGFILWFNTLALRYFPKWVLDASAALHYYEAILATLAVLIWHMYSVVFDPDVYPMDRVRLRHPEPAYAEALAEVPSTESDPAVSSGATRDTEPGPPGSRLDASDAKQASKPEEEK